MPQLLSLPNQRSDVLHPPPPQAGRADPRPPPGFVEPQRPQQRQTPAVCCMSKYVRVAVAPHEGVYVDGNDVAGTKSMRDVWDDLKIPFHMTNSSDRYQQADRILQASPQITRVAGHSLGGAVALELANRHPSAD